MHHACSLQCTQLHSRVHTGADQPQYPEYNDCLRSMSRCALVPDRLAALTNVQTGGLLSDVFLHLVPHSFMGEHQDGGVHFVMVEEKRNILIGCLLLRTHSRPGPDLACSPDWAYLSGSRPSLLWRRPCGSSAVTRITHMGTPIHIRTPPRLTLPVCPSHLRQESSSPGSLERTRRAVIRSPVVRYRRTQPLSRRNCLRT